MNPAVVCTNLSAEEDNLPGAIADTPPVAASLVAAEVVFVLAAASAHMCRMAVVAPFLFAAASADMLHPAAAVVVADTFPIEAVVHLPVVFYRHFGVRIARMFAGSRIDYRTLDTLPYPNSRPVPSFLNRRVPIVAAYPAVVVERRFAIVLAVARRFVCRIQRTLADF